jgi:hypothetical protein
VWPRRYPLALSPTRFCLDFDKGSLTLGIWTTHEPPPLIPAAECQTSTQPFTCCPGMASASSVESRERTRPSLLVIRSPSPSQSLAQELSASPHALTACGCRARSSGPSMALP